MTAESIARALGGTRSGSGWLCRCPAHEDKRPSLSIRDGRNGPIVNCFSGCDPRAVRDALRGLGLLEPFRPGSTNSAALRISLIPAPAGPSTAELRNRRQAHRIWIRADPWLSGTPAEPYLQRRGIWEAIDHEESTVLRFTRLRHPMTRAKKTAAIIVPRHDVETGDVVAIQRLFLTEYGRKYHHGDPKVSLGIAPRSWSMLHEATDRLLLAEGIENALAGSIMFSRPAWAKCGPFPSEIRLPEHVRDVLIAADHDPGGGSQRKAAQLATYIRWTGRRCAVWMPSTPGWDANDELVERQDAACWRKVLQRTA